MRHLGSNPPDPEPGPTPPRAPRMHYRAAEHARVSISYHSRVTSGASGLVVTGDVWHRATPNARTYKKRGANRAGCAGRVPVRRRVLRRAVRGRRRGARASCAPPLRARRVRRHRDAVLVLLPGAWGRTRGASSTTCRAASAAPSTVPPPAIPALRRHRIRRRAAAASSWRRTRATSARSRARRPATTARSYALAGERRVGALGAPPRGPRSTARRPSTATCSGRAAAGTARPSRMENTRRTASGTPAWPAWSAARTRCTSTRR